MLKNNSYFALQCTTWGHLDHCFAFYDKENWELVSNLLTFEELSGLQFESSLLLIEVLYFSTPNQTPCPTLAFKYSGLQKYDSTLHLTAVESSYPRKADRFYESLCESHWNCPLENPSVREDCELYPKFIKVSNWIICFDSQYGLNVYVPQGSYAEILIFNVIVIGGGASWR